LGGRAAVTGGIAFSFGDDQRWRFIRGRAV
jgi:hypothetical protein